MEALQQLTRRQLDTLQGVAAKQRADRGASLNDLAVALGVRPPSALAHLGPLEDLGLVTRRRGKTRLTTSGERCLDEYRRHHRVAESLFSRAGLSPEATCAAAKEVDLVLSHRTVEAICRSEGHPGVCPHGEPIAPCSDGKGRR